MSIVYDSQNNYLSRSVGHIPRSWESFYVFEEAQCWNCGGEFLLERRHPEGYKQYKQCWTCAFTGVIQTTVETVEFDPNWTLFPLVYNIFFIDGLTDVWEPF